MPSDELKRSIYTCYSRPISKRPMDLIKHKQLGNLLPTPKPTSLFYPVGQIISLILCIFQDITCNLVQLPNIQWKFKQIKWDATRTPISTPSFWET